MAVSPLQFNHELLTRDELEETLRVFRRDGFAIVNDVFERGSVDPYLEAVKQQVDLDQHAGRIRLDESPLSISPTRAPRLRQVIAPALHFSADTLSSAVKLERSPALFEVSWIIQDAGKQLGAKDGWHKDRDLDGPFGEHYNYPREVHTGMYFKDMTQEHGPTQAVPGSHQNGALSPYDDGRVEAFLPRKQDIVLWDQRLWHRATSRTIAGMRIFAIFGFYTAPGARQRRMSCAQRDAWNEAGDDLERVLYGGVFQK